MNLDQDTDQMVRNMIRYVTDDRFIGQYLGIPTEAVRNVRRGLERRSNPRPDHPVQRSYIGGPECVRTDSWEDAARAGTKRLAAAIARAGA